MQPSNFEVWIIRLWFALVVGAGAYILSQRIGMGIGIALIVLALLLMSKPSQP